MKRAQPAGTPEHREHFAAAARDMAFRLTEALGTGEIGDEVYRSLPVGDARCQKMLGTFLDTVERMAGELFDRAVACRDLPPQHNIISLPRKSA